MKYTIHILIISLLVGLNSWPTTLAAQSKLSLEQCIDQAWQQSRSILQANLNTQRAEIQLDRERTALQPLLQFDAQTGYQFGRNIDPTTNAFNSDGILFNSASINGSWLLYQGGRMAFAKQYQQELLTAANAQESQVKFQLQLEVTNAYLNVLLAEEYLQQQETVSQASQEQLHKIEQDIALGVRPEKEKVQLQAQLAAENRSRIDATARLEQAQLALKQLLRLPITETIEILKPSTQEWQASLLDNTQVINPEKALSAYPAYQAALAQWRASESAQAVLKADRKPRVTAFGQLNTRFSSAAQTLTDIEAVPVEQEVLLEGQPSTLTVMQAVPVYQNSPFFNQWRNNFGQAVGVRVSFPIFDQSANKLARQEANIASVQAQLTIEEEQDNFIYELNRLQNRLEAAQKTYQAAQHSADIAQQAYDMASQAFQIGASSSYELLEAKKQLNAEQARLLQAKYDCLFARKILSSFAVRS